MKLDNNKECDASRLQLLLQCDEESHEFAAGSAHIENCTECQLRLSELAADEPSWRMVRDVLVENRDAPKWDDAMPSSEEILLNHQASSAVEGMVRDCLGPPSHPEMLGRLGRYEIERVIGSGGMGVVLKGHDTELNRPVAVKVLAPHLADNATARRWFARGRLPCRSAVRRE